MSAVAGAHFGIRYLLQGAHGANIDMPALFHADLNDVLWSREVFVAGLHFDHSKRIPK